MERLLVVPSAKRILRWQLNYDWLLGHPARRASTAGSAVPMRGAYGGGFFYKDDVVETDGTAFLRGIKSSDLKHLNRLSKRYSVQKEVQPKRRWCRKPGKRSALKRGTRQSAGHHKRFLVMTGRKSKKTVLLPTAAKATLKRPHVAACGPCSLRSANFLRNCSVNRRCSSQPCHVNGAPLCWQEFRHRGRRSRRFVALTRSTWIQRRAWLQPTVEARWHLHEDGSEHCSTSVPSLNPGHDSEFGPPKPPTQALSPTLGCIKLLRPGGRQQGDERAVFHGAA